MKILQTRRLDRPIRMISGDTFHLMHGDSSDNTTTLLRHSITESMDVDILHLIEFENGELGLETGLGGVFGKEKKGAT